MRIIPFTLRITHYSRAPASWPGRPKIHVAGYAAVDSPSHAGIVSESQSEDRQRRLYGTVEMTASGDVRWTTVRLVIIITIPSRLFFFFSFSFRREFERRKKLTIFCFVLFCFVLFCFVLFCFVLFCFVLFCFVLFCFRCVVVGGEIVLLSRGRTGSMGRRRRTDRRARLSHGCDRYVDQRRTRVIRPTRCVTVTYLPHPPHTHLTLLGFFFRSILVMESWPAE
jgi:hypothetical protein